MHSIVEILREIEKVKRRVDYIEPRENVSTLIAGQLAYGEIYIHGGVAAQTIPDGAVFTKSTAWLSNGLSKNCTPDQANNQIVITETGIYKVNGSFSFYIDTPNVNVMGACFLNAVDQQQIHFRRLLASSNDEGTASVTGLIDVTQTPIVLDWRWQHDNGSPIDITITYANLNVVYIDAT